MSDAGAAQLFVLALVGLVALTLLRAAVVRETDPLIGKLIIAGFGAKMFGAAMRLYVMGDLYEGRGDFHRYLDNGTELAFVIRSGRLPEQAYETGTLFMDFIAGVVFSVIPSQLIAGTAVFASLSFIGALLFFYAFRLAVPEGNHRRYAALVFFVPTMVFWPSSIGKEAWLVFTLGISAYGAARVLRRARFGFLVVALGGAGVFLVRPHMGALFAASFAGAYLLRLRDKTVKKAGVASIIGLVIVGIGAGYAASNFGDELPSDETVEGSQTDQIAAETGRRTTQGGSAFESRPVRGPGDLLHAAVTVPFRPFPTEGHNRQSQIAGLEGVLLLGLILVSLPRVATLPRAILQKPYVALASAYSIGFIIAFSNVGNFGILTRQRAQLLPFLLVLLCLPRARDEVVFRDDPISERPRGRAPVLQPVEPPIRDALRRAGDEDGTTNEAGSDSPQLR